MHIPKKMELIESSHNKKGLLDMAFVALTSTTNPKIIMAGTVKGLSINFNLFLIPNPYLRLNYIV